MTDSEAIVTRSCFGAGFPAFGASVAASFLCLGLNLRLHRRSRFNTRPRPTELFPESDTSVLYFPTKLKKRPIKKRKNAPPLIDLVTIIDTDDDYQTLLADGGMLSWFRHIQNVRTLTIIGFDYYRDTETLVRRMRAEGSTYELLPPIHYVDARFWIPRDGNLDAGCAAYFRYSGEHTTHHDNRTTMTHRKRACEATIRLNIFALEYLDLVLVLPCSVIFSEDISFVENGHIRSLYYKVGRPSFCDEDGDDEGRETSYVDGRMLSSSNAPYLYDDLHRPLPSDAPRIRQGFGLRHHQPELWAVEAALLGNGAIGCATTTKSDASLPYQQSQRCVRQSPLLLHPFGIVLERKMMERLHAAIFERWLPTRDQRASALHASPSSHSSTFASPQRALGAREWGAGDQSQIGSGRPPFRNQTSSPSLWHILSSVCVFYPADGGLLRRSESNRDVNRARLRRTASRHQFCGAAFEKNVLAGRSRWDKTFSLASYASLDLELYQRFASCASRHQQIEYGHRHVALTKEAFAMVSASGVRAGGCGAAEMDACRESEGFLLKLCKGDKEIAGGWKTRRQDQRKKHGIRSDRNHDDFNGTTGVTVRRRRLSEAARLGMLKPAAFEARLCRRAKKQQRDREELKGKLGF